MTELVHIRTESNKTTVCGRMGETISLYFYLNHLLENKETCCKELWNRVCNECKSKENK